MWDGGIVSHTKLQSAQRTAHSTLRKRTSLHLGASEPLVNSLFRSRLHALRCCMPACPQCDGVTSAEALFGRVSALKSGRIQASGHASAQLTISSSDDVVGRGRTL